MLFDLVQASQVAGPQIVTDPKASESDHVIEERLTSRDQTSQLGLSQYSKEAGYFETAFDREAAAALLIDEQEFGLQFRCDDDGFGFAGVKLLSKPDDLVLVLGCHDTGP